MEILRGAGLILAIASALATGLGLGGAFSRRLDVLTHFAPATTVAAAAALALSGGSGRWTFWLSLVALGGCALLMGPEILARLGRRRSALPGRRLKLVQFNLWRRNVDPVATAAWLEGEDADIVVVQEAVGPAASMPEALRGLYPHRVPGPGSAANSPTILAKARPSAWGTLPSTAAGRRAAAVWASFGDGEDAFTVAGVHMAWPFPPGMQQGQNRRLAAELERFDRRSLILAGDFNSTPWSFALRRQDAVLGLRRLTLALATWPARPVGRFPWKAPFPLLAIDHVYAGQAWACVDVRKGPRLGSDHLAVVVELARR